MRDNYSKMRARCGRTRGMRFLRSVPRERGRTGRLLILVGKSAASRQKRKLIPGKGRLVAAEFTLPYALTTDERERESETAANGILFSPFVRK